MQKFEKGVLKLGNIVGGRLQYCARVAGKRAKPAGSTVDRSHMVSFLGTSEGFGFVHKNQPIAASLINE